MSIVEAFTGVKQQSVGLRDARVLGVRRQDLRRCWLTACRAAGATKITGHRTEAVYRRYAIVNDPARGRREARGARFGGTVTDSRWTGGPQVVRIPSTDD